MMQSGSARLIRSKAIAAHRIPSCKKNIVHNERFNGTLRREVLNAEWFSSIRQAKTVIGVWLKQYNHIRPHQALNMRPPVPETLQPSGT